MKRDLLNFIVIIAVLAVAVFSISQSGVSLSPPRGNVTTTKVACGGDLSCTPIRTVADFEIIRTDVGAGCYCQMNDIDFKHSTKFKAIPFLIGNYHGNGHSIDNLRISEESQYYKDWTYRAALFGNIVSLENDTLIEDLTFRNPIIIYGWPDGWWDPWWHDAAVLGNSVGPDGDYDSEVIIRNVHVINGTIISSWFSSTTAVGGLVSTLAGATIDSSSYSGVVISNSTDAPHVRVGGLVGSMAGNRSVIKSSRAQAIIEVRSQLGVGGLVGHQFSGSILDSYSSGSIVNRDKYVDSGVGGLVGTFGPYLGEIINSYSYSNVTSLHGSAGGLIGEKYGDGKVISSYWDTQTSGQSMSAGGEGKTTAQMKQKATFKSWDFSSIWKIIEVKDYPRLQWETSTAKGIKIG